MSKIAGRVQAIHVYYQRWRLKSKRLLLYRTQVATERLPSKNQTAHATSVDYLPSRQSTYVKNRRTPGKNNDFSKTNVIFDARIRGLPVRNGPASEWYILLFRPRSMQAVRTMRPIATNVTCSVLCAGHWCAVQKRLNRSRCRLAANSFGSRSHIFGWGGKDRTNPFAATRGYKSAMRPFAKLLLILVLLLNSWPVWLVEVNNCPPLVAVGRQCAAVTSVDDVILSPCRSSTTTVTLHHSQQNVAWINMLMSVYNVSPKSWPTFRELWNALTHKRLRSVCLLWPTVWNQYLS